MKIKDFSHKDEEKEIQIRGNFIKYTVTSSELGTKNERTFKVELSLLYYKRQHSYCATLKTITVVKIALMLQF